MKPIVLIGGGGHCKSVIEAAQSSDLAIAGILDVEEKIGANILGYSIIGTDSDIRKYSDKYDFIITLGHIQNNIKRRTIAEILEKEHASLANVVASSAIVSKYAEIGQGNAILHGAVVNAAAKIGNHSIINTLSNIEHGAVIGDFCHISTGVMINGNCIIGNNVFIGSGSILPHGVFIESGSIIAAGTIMRKSTVIKGLYAGNPGKLIKRYE